MPRSGERNRRRFGDDGREHGHSAETGTDGDLEARPAAGESRVCVIGLGQVGLPAALLFAREYDVLGVDVDPERVAALNEGRLPFEEPGLSELFESVEGNFSARETVVPADAYVIVTPTPLAKRVGVADLDSVRAAGEAAGSALGPGELVVLESTVPPGTTERLLGPILEGESGLARGEFGLAHCPERAIPGDSLAEMRNNDRVIGAIDERSARGAARSTNRSPRARSIRRRRRPPSW
jgi:UDP-N-acetyl-D-mannosaminuronic acid dehydrogenase